MIKMKERISGHIKLEILTSDMKVRFSSKFSNVITNEGLNYIVSQPYSPTGLSGRCYVGTNNAIPTEADTFSTMTSVGWTGTILSQSWGWNDPGDYYGYERVYQFTPASNIDGYALAEICFAYNDVAWSRTLIKDIDGDVTTITLADDEYLRVTYEIRTYPPTGDVTGAIDISGVTYDYTLRPCKREDAGFAPNRDGALRYGWVYETNDLTSEDEYPIGTNSLYNGIEFSIYSQDSYYRESSFFWNVGGGNYTGGIAVVVFGYFQVKFVAQVDLGTPFFTNIPKTDTNELTLTIGSTLARHEPEYSRGKVVDGATTTLVLTFNGALLPASPTIAAFTVDINSGTNNIVTGVSTSGMVLTITVTDAITNGDDVTFSYVKSTGNLTGSDGAEVEDITDAVIINEVT